MERPWVSASVECRRNASNQVINHHEHRIFFLYQRLESLAKFPKKIGKHTSNQRCYWKAVKDVCEMLPYFDICPSLALVKESIYYML